MFTYINNLPKIVYAHLFSIKSYEFKNRLYDFMEIAKITEGALEVTIDNKTFLAQKGDVLIIPYGSLVSCKTSSNHNKHSHYSIGFRADFNNEVGIKFEFEYINKNIKNLNELFEKLIASHSSKDEFECFSCFFELLRLVNVQTDIKNTTDIYVKKIIEYLEYGIEEQIKIPKIAEKVGLTPEYASAIFKKQTGLTIITYANKLKINKAKEIILRGGMSIEYIAKMVGIENPTYLCRIFKKHTNMTPSEYKKMIQTQFIKY